MGSKISALQGLDPTTIRFLDGRAANSATRIHAFASREAAIYRTAGASAAAPVPKLKPGKGQVALFGLEGAVHAVRAGVGGRSRPTARLWREMRCESPGMSSRRLLPQRHGRNGIDFALSILVLNAAASV